VYQKLNTKSKQDEDNVTVLLEANKAKQTYQGKKKAIKDIQAEKDLINPEEAVARVAVQKAVEEQATKEKVQAEALTESEEAETLTVLNDTNDIVDEGEREEKVNEIINSQHEKYKVALDAAKVAAVDKTKTIEERNQLKADAAKEQKKMIAIKAEISKQIEKKEQAKDLAEKQAEEVEDSKNAVELNDEEKVEIYDEIKKITFVRPSTDVNKNIDNKKEAIKRAEKYAEEFQAEMFVQKDLMDIKTNKAKE